MDNYFTSYSLFKFLEVQKIFACGTVISNRKNLPQNLSADKSLQRGEFDWAVSNENVLCLKWRDRGSKKKCVTILSTLGDETAVSSVSRKEKDGTTLQVPCPRSIITYNRNMGFVDYFDQLKSMYAIDRKSRKWWHRLFFHFVDMIVTNAFILHKELPEDTEYKNMKDFRLSVISGLVYLGQENVKAVKRSSTSGTVQIKKHKPFVPEEKRLENVAHLPVKCKQRRCAYCSTKEFRRTTTFMCKTCNVGLCMHQKGPTTCFEKFHSK